jgi:hypothetical protein
MDGSCACGRRPEGAWALGCLGCGAPCCPACAVSLESVAYCGACARRLLGGPVAAAHAFDLL